METIIRKGQGTFYGDDSFPHGISRSGYFSLRESEELATWGKTFEGLYNGKIEPTNDEESLFIIETKSVGTSTLYPVKLWLKYLNAIKRSQSGYSFSMCNGKAKLPNKEFSA